MGTGVLPICRRRLPAPRPSLRRMGFVGVRTSLAPRTTLASRICRPRRRMDLGKGWWPMMQWSITLEVDPAATTRQRGAARRHAVQESGFGQGWLTPEGTWPRHQAGRIVLPLAAFQLVNDRRRDAPRPSVSPRSGCQRVRTRWRTPRPATSNPLASSIQSSIWARTSGCVVASRSPLSSHGGQRSQRARRNSNSLSPATGTPGRAAST